MAGIMEVGGILLSEPDSRSQAELIRDHSDLGEVGRVAFRKGQDNYAMHLYCALAKEDLSRSTVARWRGVFQKYPSKHLLQVRDAGAVITEVKVQDQQEICVPMKWGMMGDSRVVNWLD
jgi:hypothetical protein